MRHLLLIAHGSRRNASNEAVMELAHQIQKRSERPVQPAFLELANPSIAEGIDLCVARGARELDILPYFLAPGRHVQQDVPQLVEQAMQDHPEVSWRLLPHLGATDGLAGFIHEVWIGSKA